MAKVYVLKCSLDYSLRFKVKLKFKLMNFMLNNHATSTSLSPIDGVLLTSVGMDEL